MATFLGPLSRLCGVSTQAAFYMAQILQVQSFLQHPPGVAIYL